MVFGCVWRTGRENAEDHDTSMLLSMIKQNSQVLGILMILAEENKREAVTIREVYINDSSALTTMYPHLNAFVHQKTATRCYS